MSLTAVFAEAMRQEFSPRDRDTDEPLEATARYYPSAEAILRRKDVREALVRGVADGCCEVGTCDEWSSSTRHMEIHIRQSREIVERMLA